MNGDVYVSGRFTGQITLAGRILNASGTDIFVLKLNSQGQELWVVQGGTQADARITVDAGASLYVMGQFPPGGVGETLPFNDRFGTEQTLTFQYSIREDLFYWKLDSAGRHVYLRRLGSLQSNESLGYLTAKDTFIYFSIFTGIVSRYRAIPIGLQED